MLTWMLPSPACPKHVLQPVDQLEQLRDTAFRHDDVMVVLDGRDRSQRVRELAADPPQLLARRLVGRSQHLGGAGVTTRPLDTCGFFIDGLGQPIDFEEEQRTGPFRCERADIQVTRHRFQ